jgi:hypothetical protein
MLYIFMVVCSPGLSNHFKNVEVVFDPNRMDDIRWGSSV